MIELSVMLPMFNAKYIGWLAFESLCRQVNVNFEWELVIAEEANELSIGSDYKQWVSRLKKLGCTRIEYIVLSKHISLGEKYHLLVNSTSPSSKSIVLQDADVYAYPTRLISTYEAFRVNPKLEWFKNNKGIFYDIQSESSALWDYSKGIRRMNSAPAGCWFSMNRESAVKKVRNKIVNRGCNSRAYKYIVPKVISTDDCGWEYGLHTHGFNNISDHRRSHILHKKYNGMVSANPVNLNKTIPIDVMDKLRSLKEKLINK